jgi:hypothetical protein
VVEPAPTTGAELPTAASLLDGRRRPLTVPAEELAGRAHVRKN